jgi:hypothetical protein
MTEQPRRPQEEEMRTGSNIWPGAVLVMILALVGPAQGEYTCGDVNGDGNPPDIADVVYFVDWAARGGSPPPVLDAANVAGCQGVDFQDLAWLTRWVFIGDFPSTNCDDQSECLPVESGAIILDEVYGELGGPGIAIGQVRFELRYAAMGTAPIRAMANGFRIYSPDGAEWDVPTVIIEDRVSLEEGFELVVEDTSIRSATVCEDTIGLSTATLANDYGIPPDFNETVIRIDFWLSGEAGTHICLDTCWYPNAGTWLWTSADQRWTPSWDGPYCWELAACVNMPGDSDCDGYPDSVDNCPQNYGQYPDIDGDGYGSFCDNCPEVYNPDQEDNDGDGVGNECCCALRGDMDGNGTAADVSDLVYLVTWMFQSGPLLPCPQHADVDNSGALDVTDLVYVATFMFGSGPAPVPCP